MRDIWAFKAKDEFEAICRSLEERQIPFDIIDDDLLEQAALSDGALCLGDAKYRRIYLPKSDYMRKGAKDAVSRFVKDGGEVIYGEATSKSEHPGIRKLVRKWEKGELYLFFNESSAPCTFPHDLGDGLYLLDAVNGKIYPATNTLTLSCGEICALIRTDWPLPTESSPEKGELIGEHLPKDAVIISKTSFEGGKLVKTAENTPITGDTAHLSGAIRYTFDFEAKAGEDIFIDLGEVRDCTSLEINEKEAGYTLFPPHLVKIDGELIKAHNNLCVTVYNSSAAAYCTADLTDAPRESVGPYYAVSAQYEKEHTECGLPREIKIYKAI